VITQPNTSHAPTIVCAVRSRVRACVRACVCVFNSFVGYLLLEKGDFLQVITAGITGHN